MCIFAEISASSCDHGFAIGNFSCDSRLLHRPMRYSSLLSTSSSSRIESSSVGSVAVFFAAALAIFIVTVLACFSRSVYAATSSHRIFAVLTRLVFSPSCFPRFLAVLSFPIVVSSCRFAVLAFSLAFSSSAITCSSVCKVFVVLLFLQMRLCRRQFVVLLMHSSLHVHQHSCA